MGYWDKHPMGGDSPLDARLVMFDTLGIGNDYIKIIEAQSEEELLTLEKEFSKKFAESLNENFDSLLEDKTIVKYSFIVPFSVIEFGIVIKDKSLSERIKALINDGGAVERGCEIKASTKENNYNNFESPNDYASQLKDNWDLIMDKKTDSSILQRCRGLLELF